MLSIMCLLSFVSNRLPPPKGYQVLTVYTNIVILLVLSPCSQVGWVGRDLNSRRHKPSDLQSDPIDHSGTYPIYYFILKESRVRFELTSVGFADQSVSHFTTETWFLLFCFGGPDGAPTLCLRCHIKHASLLRILFCSVHLRIYRAIFQITD